MSIRKTKDGWLYEKYFHNGKRLRKKFTTKSEAAAFDLHLQNEDAAKPWLEKKRDTRLLSELLEVWFGVYGQQIKSSIETKRLLARVINDMGNPRIDRFSVNDFTHYRKKRLNGQLSKNNKKISPTTLNNELQHIKAMFNELIRLGEITGANPLETVTAFRVDESEMAFLSHSQIDDLFTAADHVDPTGELSIIIRIGLSTGARWSEANGLTDRQVGNGKITFIKTKGRKSRTVPIDSEIERQIPKKSGKLFNNHYYDFIKALKLANIELPKGQATHVLRHSFASYFMMNGGNIIVLKDILGHANIKTTMRYAHFAPDHLADAMTLNPISIKYKDSKNGG